MTEIRVPVVRVNRGRPPLPDSDKLRPVTFKLDKRLLAAFDQLSGELSERKASLYRAAFEEYLLRAKIDWRSIELDS